MRAVQIVLTDDLALKARMALDSILGFGDENYQFEEEEWADFERLAVFFGQVATNPSQFSPTGAQALRVRSIVRRAKGAAQPQSRKNKRKVRQHNRIAHSKWRRKERRRLVAEHNAAVELYEQEAREAAEWLAEQEARVEGQPKFDIVNVQGQVIIAGVPAEAILAEDGSSPFTESGQLKPQLIVVGGD